MRNKFFKLLLAVTMIIPSISAKSLRIHAEEIESGRSIVDVTSTDNVVKINYSDGLVGKITFLEDNIFRMHIDPTKEFDEYAKPNHKDHKGKIQVRGDDSVDYSKPNVGITESNNKIVIKSDSTSIEFEKDSSLMTVKRGDKVIFKEAQPLTITESKSSQTLVHNEDEYFFGGGTQNGRFTHKGQSINIVNESNWVDGGVASPNPFYWSTKGYGVLRNTFKPGKYDFGRTDHSVVKADHDDNKFDAYYFLGETPKTLLQGYYKVTGNPVLLPEYAYYLGHLNAYNRDGWSETNQGGGKAWKLEDGSTYYEHGRDRDYKLPIDPESGKIPTDSKIIPETLNADSPISDLSYEELYKFSARAVIDGHQEFDMPLGYFVPNDGYGAGYGQHGYYEDYPLGSKTNEAARDKAVKDNIQNLARFSKYANDRGVMTGLWTQSALTPETSSKDSFGYRGYQTLRDFRNEVLNGGISAFKTDVAWVGPGYSMSLDSTKTVFEGLGLTNKRPNIISLNGWAGTQRHAAIWTGDQTGGDWEYIRFHIPTYIGQGLSGNPNIGSDIDGIFGGSSLITTRDIQWKVFTPLMLDMDGWGSRPKKPYGHSADHDDINRMYLKLKAELMPYIYTTAHEAIDGLPMIRAMFLEYPEDPKGYTKDVQYQFMYGSQFLVAPIYQNTSSDSQGNDIRNNIYLPDEEEVWIDYFTGNAYRGGQTINGFDAPLWKLPLFVKNGSIIPRYTENNNPNAITETNPKGLDKTQRIFEFYPAEKQTSYTVVEDDGITMNSLDENENEIANVSYGGKVKTKINSLVKDSTARLSIEKSTGSYKGYDNKKHTTAVVNLTKKPENIIVKINQRETDLKEVNSLEAFELAKQNDENVFFYEDKPNLNKYSQGDGEFGNMKIITNPKLHIAISKINAKENAIDIEIEGYEYDYQLSEDKLNESLEVPRFGEYETTPTSITLNWNRIGNATTYEIEADGEIHGGFNVDQTQFIHDDLSYNTEKTYRIRSRNNEGYSNWSEEITVSTDLDPWRNVPSSKVTTTIPEFHPAYGIKFAFDRLFSPELFHSDINENNQLIDKDIILEFEDIHHIDDLTYHVLAAYKSRFISQMDISTSLDGVHWTKVYDGSDKTFTTDDFVEKIENHPEINIDLKPAKGKFVKITPKKVNSSYITISEMIINKVDGSRSYPLGDFNLDGKIDSEDLTQIYNYKGLTEDSHQFKTQVFENNADVNNNGVFDIYDYSFVLNQMDGGSNKEGEPKGTVMYESTHVGELKAGELFTIKLTGSNLENINALGSVFKYNADEYEIISIDALGDVKNMEDISVKSSGEGNKKVATISFGNIGNKEMLSGDHELVEIKIKSLKDNSVIYPEKFMLIGPKSELLELDVIEIKTEVDKSELEIEIENAQSFINETNPLEYTEESFEEFTLTLKEALVLFYDELATQKDINLAINDLKSSFNNLKKITYTPENNISQIKFSNDEDGDIEGDQLWQQNNWKELMFDGDKSKNLLEFKWYHEDNDIPAFVKLPTDFIYTFDKPRLLKDIIVYNRNQGENGSINEISLTAIYESKEEETFTFHEHMDEYVFDGLDEKVVEIIITPKSSTGLAKGTKTGTEENRMLSIYEVSFNGLRELSDETINTQKLEETIKKAENIDLSNFKSDSVKKFNLALENARIALKNNNNTQEQIDAYTIILLQAIENLEVKVNISNLENLLDEVESKDLSIYTDESVANLEKVIAEIKDILEGDYVQKDIDQATEKLKYALNSLVEVGEEKPEEPGIGEEKPEEPGIGEEKPEEPGIGEEKPEEPGIGEEKPEEPGIGEEKPEEPGIGEEKPEEPGNVDEKTKDEILPQTGLSNITIIIGIVLISLSGLILSYRQKKDKLKY